MLDCPLGGGLGQREGSPELLKAPTSRAEHWVESCNCALMEAGEDMEGGRASWDRESLCFGLDPVLDPLQYSGHSHVVPRKLRLRARKPLAQGHRARQGYQDVIHVPYHSTFQSVQFSSFFVCFVGFCLFCFLLCSELDRHSHSLFQCIFIPPKRNSRPIAVTIPMLPPSPWNYESAVCFHAFAHSGHFL